MLLFCFSKLFLSFYHISSSFPGSFLSCRSYLSIGRSSSPRLLFLVCCFTCTMWRCFTCTMQRCYLLSPCGRMPVHPAPSLVHILPLLLPQAGVNTEYVKSAGAMKYILLDFSFLCKSRRNKKEEEKSSQETKVMFPDKVWKEIGSRWGSEYVGAPCQGVKITWSSCSFFFFLPLFFPSTSCFVIRDFPQEYSRCSSSSCRRGKLGGCA